jgi:hypothetical protein
MSDVQSSRGRWFRYFVLSAGAATGLVIVAITLVWYINRPAKPPPWNGGAITATFTGMSVLTDKPVVTFRYRVQNLRTVTIASQVTIPFASCCRLETAC